MPITLAQAQVNSATDVDYSVIDSFRRYSWLLDQMVFDDTVTPGTGGASLTYGYTRLTTPKVASYRAYNSEYPATQATRTQVSVNLKVLGDAFTVDRVLADLGPAASNEVAFQMQQSIAAVRNAFIKALIQGDDSVDANTFDGLSVALTGQTTEVTASAGAANISAGTITTQALAMAALDEIDLWLSLISPSVTGGGDIGMPGSVPPGVKAIIGNRVSINRLQALARWAGLYTEDKDDIGRRVPRYGEWVLVDAGDYVDGSGASTPIVPIASGSPDTSPLYAVTFGLDSVHCASKASTPLIRTWLPDFTTSGAVKSGEVEMAPHALVIKNTRSVGVLRGVGVQA